jgi:hypothetical protein
MKKLRSIKKLDNVNPKTILNSVIAHNVIKDAIAGIQGFLIISHQPQLHFK